MNKIMLATISFAACNAYVPGADQVHLLRSLPDLNLGALGLVTNQTGKTSGGKRTIDALLAAGFNLQAIFVPEHGLEGKIGAEKKVDHGYDQATKLPIISLYQEHGPRVINPEALAPLDTLMVDLQDSGMRHFTYISTLFLVLTAAAVHNKTVVVLDRPNPLGNLMEGPLVDPGLISFISIAPIPVRHGMTMGELARYFNTYLLTQPARLHIVPVQNYQRECLTTLHAPLSPNLRSMQSIYGYSFLGLLSEIAPFDLAVGTKHAFQCIMLPESFNIAPKKWIALSHKLKPLGITSFAHRHFSSYKKKWMSGLRIRITDVTKVSTMNALLTVLDFFKKEGIYFTFKSFDKAAGSSVLREYVEGAITRSHLQVSLHTNLKNFYEKAHAIFLYKPHPRLLNIEG